MTYEQIKALEKILEQKCKEVEHHVKAGKNSKGTDNVFAAFTQRDLDNGVARRETKNPIEVQISEAAQRPELNNRFLVDYFSNAEVWNKAVGDLRIPEISQEEFSKMTPQEQKEHEKKILKNIVISSALLANAANRITDVYPKSYELKDAFIAEYIAYARMYNFKFPDDQIPFGIDPDHQRGVCALTGSVPGYSRFSVHFGGPINAANILAKVNSIIIKVGPKIGIEYSRELENAIKNHMRDRKGNVSVDNGVNYAKNGEYELVDSDNPQRKLKTYKLTEINRAKKMYYDYKKTIPKGQARSGYYESALKNLCSGIEFEIHSFLTPEMGYPLAMEEEKTGMVNCYNGKMVSSYADIIKDMRDDFEIEVAFKLFFAGEKFNRRERMYIAERAGLPLTILKKIESYPVIQDKQETKEQSVNNFLKIKTSKMNENEKIEFLKKVLDIYKYYGEDATAERKNFLDDIDFKQIGITEEHLNDLKVREFLNEYKEALRDEYSEDLTTDTDWSTEFITIMSNSTCAEEILEEINIKDISEILQSAGSEVELEGIRPVISKKVSELSNDELKELFITEEFEMFRFESVLNAVDMPTKKKLILETIGVVQETLGDASIVRTTIEGMDADETTVDKTLRMYDQIKTILDQTTSNSRKEALDIEAMLEKVEEIDEVE